jgi:hypothetical protein
MKVPIDGSKKKKRDPCEAIAFVWSSQTVPKRQQEFAVLTT